MFFDCDPMMLRSGHDWYPYHREKEINGQSFYLHRCRRCGTRAWSDAPYVMGRRTLGGFTLYLVSAAPS